MNTRQIAESALSVADKLAKLWDDLQPAHIAIGDVIESDDISGDALRNWARVDCLTDDAIIAIAAAENHLRDVAKLLTK